MYFCSPAFLLASLIWSCRHKQTQGETDIFRKTQTHPHTLSTECDAGSILADENAKISNYEISGRFVIGDRDCERKGERGRGEKGSQEDHGIQTPGTVMPPFPPISHRWTEVQNFLWIRCASLTHCGSHTQDAHTHSDMLIRMQSGSIQMPA